MVNYLVSKLEQHYIEAMDKLKEDEEALIQWPSNAAMKERVEYDRIQVDRLKMQLYTWLDNHDEQLASVNVVYHDGNNHDDESKLDDDDDVRLTENEGSVDDDDSFFERDDSDIDFPRDEKGKFVKKCKKNDKKK